jgi:pSer/pThr/pTyr-binding forkhead associated (FHA) protein
MASTDELVSYTSELVKTQIDGELQQRLGLYQVFLKLYEHNRGLLDEFLSLENSVSKPLASVTLPYVQGVALGQQAFLVTNLLESKTQALMQPQQTWLIGRDPRRVMIPIQDLRLSRCHAAIKYVENEGFYLIDLGSSNGSQINGEPIRQFTLLKDGDRVRLGSLTFVFFLCQSAQNLKPMSAGMPAHLKNWQPPTPAQKSLDPSSDLSQDLANSQFSSLNPFEETSRLLR